MAEAADNQVRVSNDETPAKDILARNAYRDAVKNLVLNVNPPFTVGILGDWGTGKTTFMKQVRDALNETSAQTKCRTVMFNLWEHEHDKDPIVAMLHEARRQLPEEGKDVVKKSKEKVDSPAADGGLTNNSKVQLLLLSIDLLSAAGVVGGDPTFTIPSWLIPLLVKGGSAAWKWVREHAPQVWNLAKDSLSMAEDGADVWKTVAGMKRRRLKNELTQTLAEPVDHEVELKALFQDVLEHLAGVPKGASSGEQKNRVVFFIDDLDRCTPATTVALLERIKLFLYNNLCVFVIGLDDIATQKAVARVHQFDAYDPARANSPERPDRDSSDSSGSELSGGEPDAQHYLEKIIQFPFRIPPVGEKEHRKYIADILKANGLSNFGGKGRVRDGFVISVFDAALIEVNASLRLVKRLVNLFTFNHLLAEPNIKSTKIGGREVEYDPAIMAAVTALQVLHEKAYRDLCSGRNRDRRGQMLAELFCSDSQQEGLWDPKQVGKLQQFRQKIRQIETFTKEDLEENRSEIQAYYDQYIQWAAASAPALTQEEVLASTISYKWFNTHPEVLDQHRSLDGEGHDMDLGEWIKRNWDGQPWWSETPLRLSAGGLVWRVMKMDDGETRALLLSEYVIADGPYHENYSDMTWEKSNIREWLNGEFLTRLEQNFRQRVLEADVKAAKNPYHPKVPSGKNTKDHVFILSILDLADALPTDREEKITGQLEERRLGLIATRPPSSAGELRSVWWLRSFGGGRGNPAVVNDDGKVGDWTGSVASNRVGVRPALWINL